MGPCRFFCAVLASGSAFGSGVSTLPLSFTADNGTTGSLKICLKDATDHGISGVHLNWANYSGGTVAIGGSATSPVPASTGADGCVNTTITANSVPPDQPTDYIRFSAPHPYESATPADLTLSAQWTLQASPQSIPGSGTSMVTLTLSSYGNAQPGVLIVASCSSSGGASVAVANSAILTNGAGQSMFSLTPSGFSQSTGSQTCSFSTSYTNAVTPAEVTIFAPPAAPDHLAFGLQPNDVPEGQQLDGVTVEILKSGSNALDTADNATKVTLTTTTTVCGNKVAFGPITAVGGIANFTDIGPHFYSLTSAPLRLAATSSPKLTGATSNTFNVVPDNADFIFAGGMESCSL